MDEDILTQLYNGRIVPWEKSMDNSTEMHLLKEKTLEEIDAFEKILDEGERAVMEKILDDYADLGQLRMCEAFKDGFRLGARIALAMTSDKP